MRRRDKIMARRTTVRAIDGEGDREEYKQRSVYERYKTIIVLVGALSGGGIAGVGVKFYNTNEVNETPARVERLQDRVSNYIDSHAREEALNKQLLMQSLGSLEKDLEELKDKNTIIHNKLDELTRLVRNGHPSD